jgi:hypothetical protein
MPDPAGDGGIGDVGQDHSGNVVKIVAAQCNSAQKSFLEGPAGLLLGLGPGATLANIQSECFHSVVASALNEIDLRHLPPDDRPAADGNQED